MCYARCIDEHSSYKNQNSLHAVVLCYRHGECAFNARSPYSTFLDQDQVFLLVATNLRAQAEFNPRAFHGVVAAPDASFLDMVPGVPFHPAVRVLWAGYLDR
jgi:hypothetical protein